MCFLSKIQHNLNELHIYCRLREKGIPEDRARKLAKLMSPKEIIYRERLLHKIREYAAVLVAFTGFALVSAESDNWTALILSKIAGFALALIGMKALQKK